MFKQKRILQDGLAEQLDLIDDIPAVSVWRAPFQEVSQEPDGYSGISAYWIVEDRDGNIIAEVFCREAAVAMVRAFNSRTNHIAADTDPVVVRFVLA